MEFICNSIDGLCLKKMCFTSLISIQVERTLLDSSSHAILNVERMYPMTIELMIFVRFLRVKSVNRCQSRTRAANTLYVRVAQVDIQSNFLIISRHQSFRNNMTQLVPNLIGKERLRM